MALESGLLEEGRKANGEAGRSRSIVPATGHRNHQPAIRKSLSSMKDTRTYVNNGLSYSRNLSRSRYTPMSLHRRPSARTGPISPACHLSTCLAGTDALGCTAEVTLEGRGMYSVQLEQQRLLKLKKTKLKLKIKSFHLHF